MQPVLKGVPLAGVSKLFSREHLPERRESDSSLCVEHTVSERKKESLVYLKLRLILEGGLCLSQNPKISTCCCVF